MKKEAILKKIKKFFKKFWFIVWKDDSFKGWIASLLFLFVVIKLIFFPLMTLITGTTLPLVIVESCSMYHEGNLLSNYENWFKNHDLKYFEYGINEKDWQNFPFKKGFNKGDILFVMGTKPEDLQIGDIIIFEANYRNPVIHRIINIKEKNGKYYFSTIGDNNNGQISFEKEIRQDQIIGEAKATIAPYFGWIKLIFFENLKPLSERGFCTQN